jgi:hypothetical protein
VATSRFPQSGVVTKDTFYLMLFAYLKEAPTSDKVVVLGDFNEELGSVWQE